MSAAHGGWCTRCDTEYEVDATTCAECGLVFDEPSVQPAEPAPPPRPRDRAQVVLVACLVVVALELARTAAQQFELHGAEVRVRIAFAALLLGPASSVLLVVAAVVALASRRRSLSTRVLAAVVFAVSLAGAVSVLTITESELGSRAGYSVAALGGLVLAAAAFWVAGFPGSAQPVADPPGEAPDGGLGSGDLVGETELDGLLGP